MKKFSLLFCIVSFSFLNAQRIITGHVYDWENKKPLSDVNVKDDETNRWTITQTDGSFSIQLPTEKEIVLQFSLPERETEEIQLSPGTNTVTIYLSKKSLRLDNITVTSKPYKKYSELTLGKEAIENVQAFSLNDVLLQLPGQMTPNFDMNEFKNLVFRTAITNGVRGNLSGESKQDRSDYFGNKAFGTSIMLNNIPLSNNENMQQYSPNTYSGNLRYSTSGAYNNDYVGYTFDSNVFSNSNYGYDLREVSTNTIEEVEVIQGIPSAKYGDLTSGLVLVTSKVGETPYRAYISMRDATTEFNLTKGLRLNSNNFFNFGINYLDSKADARNSLLDYQRISGSLSWKFTNPKKTITNTLNINYRFNLDKGKKDPDDVSSPLVKNEKKGFSILNNFKWNINKHFADALNIDASISYDKQVSRREKWVNTGIAAIPTSMKDGIYEAVLTPSQYTTVTLVEGIPISTYWNAELVKSFSTPREWTHNLSFGTSLKTSTNKGRGRISQNDSYSNFLTVESSQGSLGYRDYSFKNSKTEAQYSVYIQDNITKYFKDDQVLSIDTGLRFDNQLGYSTWQPRINSSFAFNKRVRLRGGFGVSSKAPSLNQLYTGDRYFDRLLGNGIYILPGYYEAAWMQTIVTPGNNLDLNPSQSYKTEMGIDVNLPFASVNLTAYYNQLKDGFVMQQLPVSITVPKAEVIVSGTSRPTYEITGTETVNYFNNILTNNLESEDKGIETFINFKKIKSLNLDISVNGSYVETKNFSDRLVYLKSANTLATEKYGVFNPLQSKDQLLTLGSTFNFHLPKIGLIISVRTEHMLIQTHKRANDIYPQGYLDENFVYHEIPESERTNVVKYGHLIQKDLSFQDKLQKTLHNFHLRVSKDFLNGFKVSFYANNFLNLKPTYTDSNNNKILYDIASFSFGGKIEYEF